MISTSAMRHWVSGVFIVIAVAMVVLGQTALSSSLQGYNYIFYWSACMLMTLLAALTALSEMAAIRRDSRREHHQLVEESFKDVGSGPFSGQEKFKA